MWSRFWAVTSVVVSTAWNLHLGAHNQTHSPFPVGEPGWTGQLLQWRWDDPRSGPPGPATSESR